MAMTVASLAGKIKAELIVEFGAAQRDDWLTKFSNAMARAVLDEVHNNGTIVLAAADVQVDPGSFIDSLTGAVTGQGDNAAVTIPAGVID